MPETLTAEHTNKLAGIIGRMEAAGEDADSIRSVVKLYHAQNQNSTTEAPEPPGFFQRAVGPYVETAKQIWERGGPAVANDMIQGVTDQFSKNLDDPRFKNVPKFIKEPAAAFHAVVEPFAAPLREDLASGNYMGAAGDVASFFLPKAIGKTVSATKTAAKAVAPYVKPVANAIGDHIPGVPMVRDAIRAYQEVRNGAAAPPVEPIVTPEPVEAPPPAPAPVPPSAEAPVAPPASPVSRDTTGPGWSPVGRPPVKKVFTKAEIQQMPAQQAIETMREQAQMSPVELADALERRRAEADFKANLNPKGEGSLEEVLRNQRGEPFTDPPVETAVQPESFSKPKTALTQLQEAVQRMLDRKKGTAPAEPPPVAAERVAAPAAEQTPAPTVATPPAAAEVQPAQPQPVAKQQLETIRQADIDSKLLNYVKASGLDLKRLADVPAGDAEWSRIAKDAGLNSVPTQDVINRVFAKPGEMTFTAHGPSNFEQVKLITPEAAAAKVKEMGLSSPEELQAFGYKVVLPNQLNGYAFAAGERLGMTTDQVRAAARSQFGDGLSKISPEQKMAFYESLHADIKTIMQKLDDLHRDAIDPLSATRDASRAAMKHLQGQYPEIYKRSGANLESLNGQKLTDLSDAEAEVGGPHVEYLRRLRAQEAASPAPAPPAPLRAEETLSKARAAAKARATPEPATAKVVEKKLLTKQDMVDRGADGHLSFGVLEEIPVSKVIGREPTPSMEGGYKKGTKIEQPIEVTYDPDQGYILSAGNHRITQAEINGQSTIPAFVEYPTRVQALKRINGKFEPEIAATPEPVAEPAPAAAAKAKPAELRSLMYPSVQKLLKEIGERYGNKEITLEEANAKTARLLYVDDLSSLPKNYIKEVNGHIAEGRIKGEQRYSVNQQMREVDARRASQKTASAKIEIGQEGTYRGRKKLVVRGTDETGATINSVDIEETANGSGNYYVSAISKNGAIDGLGTYTKKEAVARAEAFLKGEANPFESLEKGQPIQDYAPINAKIKPMEGIKGFVSGEVSGEPVWSNGHVLFKSKIPGPIVEGQAPDLARAFDFNTKNATSKTTPVGAFMNAGERNIVFSNGAVIKANYFDHARKSFPNAEFFGSDNSGAIVAKEGPRTVGVIMPIRVHTIPGGIPESLRSSIEANPSKMNKTEPAPPVKKANKK